MGVSVTRVAVVCVLGCWVSTVTSQLPSPPHTLPLPPPHSPLLPLPSPHAPPIPSLLALLQDGLGEDIGSLTSPGISLDPGVEAVMAMAGEEGDEEHKGQMEKRVFLSRGWGPGGYETPPPAPPNRFVRRPPVPLARPIRPRPIAQALRDKSVMGAHFSSLVSKPEDADQSSSPPYRRFHSIFTSGTWSPLGKRAVVQKSGPKQWEEDMQDIVKEETRDEGERNPQHQELKLGEKMRHPGPKRSGVFASHGWGAGGLPTPRRNQWVAMMPTYPAIAPRREGGGGRHTAHFRPTGQHTKPLYHLFVSNGWGPMGR